MCGGQATTVISVSPAPPTPLRKSGAKSGHAGRADGGGGGGSLGTRPVHLSCLGPSHTCPILVLHFSSLVEHLSFITHTFSCQANTTLVRRCHTLTLPWRKLVVHRLTLNLALLSLPESSHRLYVRVLFSSHTCLVLMNRYDLNRLSHNYYLLLFYFLFFSWLVELLAIMLFIVCLCLL